MGVKFGVMGTAKIATKVARAITLANNAELFAIASRSEGKAAEWARTNNVPRSYDSYEALLKDPEVEAVYIPLPPSMHCEWTVKAAEHGKHVLSEKPLAGDVHEARKMLDACRKNNVQLMDGVMWVHHDRVRAMEEAVKRSAIGALRRVTAAFAFNWGATIPLNNIRSSKELGGGAIGDLGYYCVRAILWAFGAVPERVFARARYANGVDIETSAMLFYSEERTASFDCGFTMKGRCWLELAGSDASLSLDDFVVPASEETSSYWLSTKIGDKTASAVGPCVQEVRMIERFASVVQSGKLDPKMAQDALDTVRICGAIARSAETNSLQKVL
jgi:predicted dehydrogenase